MATHGAYEKAAQIYLQTRCIGQAIACYKMSGNQVAYFKYLLLYEEKQFIREVLLHSAIDYNSDIKPYLIEKEVKEKLERLCMNLYETKLKQQVEDKQLLIWEIESLNENLIKKVDQLKEEVDGREKY